MHMTLNRLLIAFGCAALLACGSTQSTGDESHDGAPDSPAPPGGKISPEGLDLSFIPGGDMELIALTLQEGAHGPELLVAMRNPGPEFVCLVELQAAFGTTAEGDMGALGTATMPVMGAMYQTPDVMNCVGPGEIGFGGRYLDVGIELSPITRVYYRFSGYLYPTATKIQTVSIEGLTVGPYVSSGTTVRGKLQNSGPTSIFFPVVQAFSLNDVGRPLAQDSVYEDREVAPGSGWSFEVPVPGPFATHNALFTYSDQ
jgi:hypothetical protein